MSSEAAQKAYPTRTRIDSKHELAQEAFDRGAVETLRQAAAQIRGKRNNPADADWLDMMADEWVVGQ